MGFLLTWLAMYSNNCGLENETYQSEEEVEYKVYYNWRTVWVGAGSVKFSTDMETIGDQKALHLIADGKTYRRYDWFYKVRDTYESWVDPVTSLPYQFRRDVNEGGYTIFNDYQFDRASLKVNCTNEDFKTSRYEITKDISSCTQDILSAVYYARCIDFTQYSKNDTIPLTIFLDNELYEMYIRYLGKEIVEVGGKTYRCHKIAPKLIEGTIFKGGEGMSVWVTDDANKIPVLVETPIVVGSIKAVLTGYKGLKHPFLAEY